MMKCRKLISMVICIVMVCAGCQTGNSREKDDKKMQINQIEDAAKKEEALMGRYVEEEIMLPEGTLQLFDISRLDSGLLQIVTRHIEDALRVYTSSDEGNSWEANGHINGTLIPEGHAVAEAVIYDDGNIFAAYSQITENDVWGIRISSDYRFKKITPEGNTEEITPQTSKGETGASLGVTAEGNMVVVYQQEAGPSYAAVINKETLKTEKSYEMRSGRINITNKGIFISTENNMYLFDLNTGEEQECTNLPSEYRSSTSFADAGETGQYYIVHRSGIYSYRIGGSIMEQLLDGSFTALSSQESIVDEVREIGERQFAMIYTQWQASDQKQALMFYNYDENIPAVPEKEVTIYSLKDNPVIRQLIYIYQKQNPDLHVIYEVGMEDEAFASETDAIKQLNVEIMAGSGPDILVLDGLPLESYQQKGILEDISPLVQKGQKEAAYFDNIIKAYERDGSLSAVPINFKIPVILGKQEALQAAGSLEELLSFVNSKAAAGTSGISSDLLYRKRLLLYTMAVYGGDFMDGEQIAEAQFKIFLESVRSIYEEISKFWEINTDDLVGETDREIAEARARDEYLGEVGVYLDQHSIYHGETVMSIGSITEIENLADIYSLAKVREGIGYEPLSSSNHYFMPGVTVGLSSKAAEREAGTAFLEFIFSREGQEALLTDYGLPVCREVMERYMEKPDDQTLEKMGGSWREQYWPDEAYFQEFIKLVEGLDTPAWIDVTILNELDAQAGDYFKDEKSIQQAVSDFTQKMNLYLAE